MLGKPRDTLFFKVRKRIEAPNEKRLKKVTLWQIQHDVVNGARLDVATSPRLTSEHHFFLTDASIQHEELKKSGASLVPFDESDTKVEVFL